ncbi:MAG: polyamine aminopropyltransferase [Dehalococcoidia bacterium]
MEREGNTWFRESISEHVYQECLVADTVYSGQSPYQWIQVLDILPYGRVLVLDGKTQSAESDEFIYHEALVHPAMVTHPFPEQVFIAGGGEGATLREVLSHKTVQRAVMVDIDKAVIEASRKYLPSWHQGAFDDPRTELYHQDARQYLMQSDALFDVIIIDLSDPVVGNPAAPLFTREFYEMVLGRLTPQGTISIQAESTEHLTNRAFTAICNTVKAVFPSFYPYSVGIPSFGVEWGFVMASKSSNCTPPSPQKVDRTISDRLTRQLRSYDGITHSGMFSLPKHLREALKAETRIITEKEPLVVA